MARPYGDRAGWDRWREAQEIPEGADVAAVVAGTVDRRLSKEGTVGSAEQRMIQDSREGRLADMAAADVLVAVDAGTERCSRVVAMNHTDVFEAESSVGFGKGAVEALGRADFEAGGEKMSGVETNAGSGSDAARAASVEHVAEMPKFGGETSSLPCSVFEEDPRRRGRRRTKGRLETGATRSAGDGFGDVFDSARNPGIAGGAGMHDEIVGTELKGTDNFVAKGSDGIFPLVQIRGGQINEVIRVNGDGAQSESGAALAKTVGDVRGDVALMRAGPHARARGEDLERSAANAGGHVECA